VAQRWVFAYRSPNIVTRIATNNGLERQNRVLKHDYLVVYRKSTLSRLLTVIVDTYLPDAYVKWVITYNSVYIALNQALSTVSLSLLKYLVRLLT